MSTKEKKFKSKPSKSSDLNDTGLLKTPPHAIEAEQSILGGLLLDNQAWDKVSGKLCTEDFYRHEHRMLFEALADLSKRDQPFDVITLAESLKSLGELENVGGEPYLFELSNNIPSVANIAAYVDIVREKSVHRQLISVSNQIAETAYNPDGRKVSELLDIAETKVFAIAEQTGTDGGPQIIKDVLEDTPTYFTFDIDGIDPTFAPGTGTPEVGGINVREAQLIIRHLNSLNFIGADVVEVSPPFDVNNMTSLVGATIAFEILCTMTKTN